MPLISFIWWTPKNQQPSVGECTLFARTNRTLEIGYIKRHKASFNKNQRIENTISDINIIK